MYAARSAPGADEAVKAIAATAFSRSGQQVEFLDRLNQLEVPVMIVWGELDRVVPARQAMAAAIALPTAWLEIFEGVGHVPQIEAAPAFTASVRDWLESLPRP
jgi:pimeloyl-ACP methyl ester carboxylesterase